MSLAWNKVIIIIIIIIIINSQTASEDFLHMFLKFQSSLQ